MKTCNILYYVPSIPICIGSICELYLHTHCNIVCVVFNKQLDVVWFLVFCVLIHIWYLDISLQLIFFVCIFELFKISNIGFILSTKASSQVLKNMYHPKRFISSEPNKLNCNLSLCLVSLMLLSIINTSRGVWFVGRLCRWFLLTVTHLINLGSEVFITFIIAEIWTLSKTIEHIVWDHFKPSNLNHVLSYETLNLLDIHI